LHANKSFQSTIWNGLIENELMNEEKFKSLLGGKKQNNPSQMSNKKLRGISLSN
jgi:hypothetical protein